MCLEKEAVIPEAPWEAENGCVVGWKIVYVTDSGKMYPLYYDTARCFSVGEWDITDSVGFHAYRYKQGAERVFSNWAYKENYKIIKVLLRGKIIYGEQYCADTGSYVQAARAKELFICA